MSAARSFLDRDAWRGRFYSGGWREAQHSQDIAEPASGTVLSRVGVAAPADIARAAQLASAAQPAWAALNFEQRAGVFRTAARLAQEHSDEIIDWIMRETGAIRPKGQFELQMTIRCLYEAGAMPSQPQGLMLPSLDGRLSFCRRMPLGVVGVITPFNFPLYLSVRALAPALAVGNTVVLKPDLRTPVVGGFILARLFEAAGLPAEALHVLPGGADAGEALCTDANVAMIQFTGSSATGRRVGELAGRSLKKISLELGGKNALVVLDDADLDLAVSNAAWGAYLHQGQICMAAGRVLVQRALAQAFVERMAAKARQLPVGDPATAQVALGPLISERQRDRAHAIVQDSVKAGARLVTGGTYERLFYQPTVLADVAPGMRVFEEEIFAPVVAVTAFDTDAEAVELANRTAYGLSAAVISRSVERALSLGNQLHTGLLHVNDQTVNDEGINPFGGRGQSGNGTNIGGPANWDEFTQWQWVTVKDSATRYPL
ncbi:MAG TPA: benzaldehyde dehydrogenase [Steroidobacteraceae bacterium]|jgi:benzaldehyde dehydrogenase (NAD)|nr:benzaldehyde dehydrogenase [Steroidobacteraceae bacterium]